MKYGQRMERLLLQAKKIRREFGDAIGCGRQNLSQMFSDARGTDQKLTLDSHFRAAEFFGIDPVELYTGIPAKSTVKDSNFSFEARTLATFFDKIPAEKDVARALVYQDAMKVVLDALQQLTAPSQQLETGR